MSGPATFPSLEGLRFVITGGAQGIGAATAAMAVASGAEVVVSDVADDRGRALVEELSARGKAHYVRGDVSDPAQCTELIAESARLMGGIDVLHNNAGVSDAVLTEDRSLETMSVETWDRLQAINVRGPFLLAQAALPHLRRSGNPSIINAGSIATFTARPNTLAYATSKAAIGMLTQVMALELAPDGIRVNAYAPGMVESAMSKTYLESAPDPARAKAAVLHNYLSPRLGQPDDIAAVVCFLASREAAFVNGVVWAVDGGFTAWKASPGELNPGARA